MFTLNTKSGFLHKDDHEASGESFTRADEADLRARKLGTKMKFCRVCFGDNRNTQELDRLREKEDAILSGDSKPGDSMTTPQRVTTEAPPTSVHASDSSVPAGRLDPLSLPQTPQPNQTDR